MPSKTKTALAALLFFGSASAVLVNTNNRNDHHGSVARRAVSVTMSSGRAETVNSLKPFTAEENGWFVPPRLTLAQRAPFCRPGITDRTTAWIPIDGTRREPDPHQRRTGNFRQI
jgi:hypothetical protein